MTCLIVRRKLILSILLLTFIITSARSKDSSSKDPCTKSIQLLFSTADSIYALGNQVDENITVLWDAENTSKKCESWDNQVLALLKLSIVYNENQNDIGFMETADSAYQVAINNLPKDHIYFAYIFEKLTYVERKQRQYQKAINTAYKGLEVSKGQILHLEVVFNNRIADNNYSLGNYAKALDYSKKAENIISNAEVHYFLKYDTYEIAAYVNKKLGDMRSAEEYYLKAEQELLKDNFTNDQNELLNLWLDLAQFYITEDKNDIAQNYFNKIANSGFTENDISSGGYYNALALKELKKEQYQFEDVIQLLVTSNNYYSEATTTAVSLAVKRAKNLELIGDIYFDQNNYEKSKLYFQKALDVLDFKDYTRSPDQIENKAQVINILSKIFDIEALTEKNSAAIEVQNSILDLVKHLSINNSDASIKEYWANHNQELFEKLLDYNLKIQNNEAILHLIEENKSNILMKDVSDDISLGYANVPKEFINEVEETKSEILYYNNLLQKEKESEIKDSTLIQKCLYKLNHLEISLDKNLITIESEFPEYHALKYNLDRLRVKELQNDLRKDDVLMEYFVGSSKGYVAFVSNAKIKIIEIEGRDSIHSLALNYYESLSNKNVDLDHQSAKLLYKNLMLHVINEVNPKAKNLIIVADDMLNNIAFGNLINDQGVLLLDQYNIQYQYSARLWQMMKSRKTKKKTYDIVGYAFDNKKEVFADNRSCFELENAINLKCAEKEVRSAVEEVGSKNSLIAGHNISELFASANNTKILHLATHACLDDTDSEYSRIYFNDTLLTNQDLKLKDFSADLVVLSACETGFGEVIKGEGSMSLSKGFFHAGAKSTLVSLWPVDDCATSDLMGYFYKNLKEGQSKDEALRNAKINYRQYANPEKTHPYYWAGFIVIGDCSPIWSNGISLWYMLLVPLIIILMLLLLKIYKSGKNLA